jgi:Uma2 family endonuclease
MGTKKTATYEDLKAVAPTFVAEISAGELYASPRPAYPHAHACSMLGALLIAPFVRGLGGPGGWLILDEPELHLGDDVLVPDLAGWRRDRLPKALGAETAYFTLAPDWVCEVISPRTARLDRIRKKPAYARAGVGHLWLIDPLARTLEVLQLEQGRWVDAGNFGADQRVPPEPFSEVALPLSELWVPGTEGEPEDSPPQR